jgi:flagellar biosynthesis component FlhA
MDLLFRWINRILAFIAIINISVSVFITLLKIEKNDPSNKKVFSALFFAFTILGIYAIKNLIGI